ncbi:glycosyltransferase [Spirosoma sp. SC4-14]|uniref:glycosyltransferase family 2 protein n=1 Tax=Spirosoma sp. SC4-14 TaxID=3128900 RepID=UPI0030CD2C3F
MIFSVIIPTYNRSDFLIKCLDSLTPCIQMLDTSQYEVIVSDDGEDGLTKQLVNEAYPWVRWVKGPGRGPASNRNNGARLAKGEWLVFIDDDCISTPDLLIGYKNVIDGQENVRALEGKIVPDSWEKLDEDMAECPINITGGCFWSANICLQKSLFESISGFDEDFFLAAREDQDLYLRIKRVCEVVFVSEAVVIHPVRIATFNHKVKNIFKSIDNWFVYVSKHNYLYVNKNLIKFAFHPYTYQMLVSARNMKLKSFFYNFLYVSLGIPYFIKKTMFEGEKLVKR